MRAVVESPRMTELNGIHADRVSAFSWALSSLFAGMAGVLIAPTFNTLAAQDFFNLVVVAIAAAAVGRLVSLPLALVGGLGLGIFISLFDTFLPRWSDDYTFLVPIQDNITPAIPFVVLFGVLVLRPGHRPDPRGHRSAVGGRPAAPVARRRVAVGGRSPGPRGCSRSCSSRSSAIVVFTQGRRRVDVPHHRRR